MSIITIVRIVDGENMSRPPFMLDCPVCKGSGKIILKSKSYHNSDMKFQDICFRCGGKGRVAAGLIEKRRTGNKFYKVLPDEKWAYAIKLRRTQRKEMKDWIAFQKKMIYGGEQI